MLIKDRGILEAEKAFFMKLLSGKPSIVVKKGNIAGRMCIGSTDDIYGV